MISRARILEKNGPAILGGGDCRITCLARILKFDVRSKKTCDLRISSRAAAPEEYETARESVGIGDRVLTCNARIDCREAGRTHTHESKAGCLVDIDRWRIGQSGHDAAAVDKHTKGVAICEAIPRRIDL